MKCPKTKYHIQISYELYRIKIYTVETCISTFEVIQSFEHITIFWFQSISIIIVIPKRSENKYQYSVSPYSQKLTVPLNVELADCHSKLSDSNTIKTDDNF